MFLLDLPGAADPIPDLKALVGSRIQIQPESFHFTNFTAQKVVAEISRMMSKKSPSYDGIIITQLHDGIPVLAPLLAELFNKIVATGQFPDIWKR